MNVEWRVVSVNDHYEVSEMGQIRRRTKTRPGVHVGQKVDGRKGRNGYMKVSLWRDSKAKTYLIHRLVCEAFHGPAPFPDAQVAHTDGTRDNNHKDNLRWTDAAGNAADRLGHGTQQIGAQVHTCKLTEADVSRIRSDPRKQRDIAADYGITQANVWAIKRRKTWKHHGEAA